MENSHNTAEDWERRRAAVLAGVSHRDLLALALFLSRRSTPWDLADSIDHGAWHYLRPHAAEALYPVRVSIQPVPDDDPGDPSLF